MRPAVAALGAVTSLGKDWPTTWQALLRGARSSVLFADFDTPRSLHVPDEVPVSAIPELERSLTSDGCGAAGRLVRSVLEQITLPGLGVIRLYGASNHSETDILLCLSQNEAAPSSLWRALLIDAMPDSLSWNLGTWVYSACTSSSHALAAALLDFADGESQDAIVVSADALSSIAVAGFWRAQATTHKTCTPFQEQRDGILIGEGAAGLRLRPPSRTSDGQIHLLGIGMSCDAGHPTDPDPTGTWLEQAIYDAINWAGFSPQDLRGIVSHGTGTKKNDAIEASVYHRIWPNAEVPITSIKGAIGHTMGAAGLCNVLVAVEASRTGLLPPTVSNGSNSIEGIDLVRDSARQIEVGAPVLAVASGFGGNNFACIVG